MRAPAGCWGACPFTGAKPSGNGSRAIMGGDRFPRRFEVSVSDPKTVPTMGAPDASDAVYDARTLVRRR